MAWINISRSKSPMLRRLLLSPLYTAEGVCNGEADERRGEKKKESELHWTWTCAVLALRLRVHRWVGHLLNCTFALRRHDEKLQTTISSPFPFKRITVDHWLRFKHVTNVTCAWVWCALLWNLIVFDNSGGARKFVTDRIEAMYGLRWNSVFTCSDLTADEAVNNHSLYYQYYYYYV